MCNFQLLTHSFTHPLTHSPPFSLLRSQLERAKHSIKKLNEYGEKVVKERKEKEVKLKIEAEKCVKLEKRVSELQSEKSEVENRAHTTQLFLKKQIDEAKSRSMNQ